MQKAGHLSQSPSSPGPSGGASIEARTGSRPLSGIRGSQDSSRDAAFAESPCFNIRNDRCGPPPLFQGWPPHLDDYLTKTLATGKGRERDVISSIRGSHPELTQSLIWFRIVYLGLTNRKRAPYRKHEWADEEDEILWNEYGRSRSSSHAAIEKIIAMHPDWSRDAIVWRARVLGLTQRRTNAYQPWTTTLDHQLLSLRGCQPDTVAKRLGCTKKAILGRLRRLGRDADFFAGFKTKDLMRELRVSREAVGRWIRLGWLKRRKGRITEESLRWLCRRHPEEIPFETLGPEARNWLMLSLDYGRGVLADE